jgi:AcrR family transcriptional regulator
MAPRDTDKRDAILDAALELFGERGFHGTAVPLVAERAGVGAGTIYRYFDSKEALVNALYRQWKQAMLASVIDGFPIDQPLRTQFNALWTRWASFVLDHPKVALFLELHHHAPYLDAESRAIEDRVLGMATALVELGRAQGLIRDIPAPLLLALVHGMFVGLVRAHADGRLTITPDVIAASERCCWEAIRA